MKIVQYKQGYSSKQPFWNRYTFAFVREEKSQTLEVKEIGGNPSITAATPSHIHLPSTHPGIATMIYNDEE